MSARNFLVRGLLAGLVAGLLAFAVAHLVGEPALERAVAIEGAGGGHGHGPGAPSAGSGDDPGLFTRGQQSGPGLLTATLATGLALGGLMGVLSALASGRLGRLGAGGSALAVAGTGFTAAVLVPFVAYPPNPPGVGEAATIGARTFWYFLVMFVALAAAVLAVAVARDLQPRLGPAGGVVTAVAGYLLAMGLLVAVVPSYREVGADVPAQLLWDFRLGALATQAALWGGTAAVLALWLDLSSRARPAAP